MPIEYEIHHDRRLVIAEAKGILTDEDVFDYQRTVWLRPEVAGYDELVNMSDVERIALPSPSRIEDLARLSANMDAPDSAARFAIVAPDDYAFGLGRMYATYRELNPSNRKQVSVFRTLSEALKFLKGEGEENPLVPG
jgi:hypothetical protein